MTDAQQAGTPVPRGRNSGALRTLPVMMSGWRWLPLSAVVIVADHALKVWITHHFSLYERVHVLPVLDVILTYNTGAAFSFLSQASGWQRWLFVALALIVSAVLIGWLRRLNAGVHGLLACGLSLIVGGALGNMLDRLTVGRVVDFVHVHWGHAYFPAFNLADSAITVGAVLLIIDAWRETRGARKVRV